MNNLAINGGTPVFEGKKAAEYAPEWPLRFPETEKRLVDVFRSGNWGGGGFYEKKLMTEFAAWQGAKHSIWMVNGTVTMECALLALGVGPGDEVIVPGVSWIATAEVPVYVGATPVIVDIDPETLCIDPARIEEAITPRTKAIIPVHLFSAMADMPKIMEIARKHNLYVIEDCAHAHGAKQKNTGAGAWGDYGSFSFQSSKLMTGGEGGCCTTNDDNLCDLVYRASHIGTSITNPKVMPKEGFICHQYRFTEFQGAVIYEQLLHQDELKAKRTRSMQILAEKIKNTPAVKIQRSSYDDDERAFYFPSILLDPKQFAPGVDRDTIMNAMAAEGIDFNIGWGFPLYRMGVWNVPAAQFVKKDTPVCDEVMLKSILVCSNSLLLADEWVVEKIGEAIDKVMNAFVK